MGLKMKAIAEKTGIPYHTIISWRQEQMREGIFHAVAISETSSKVATVTVPTVACDPVGTVTVATPDGYRIEATNYQSVVHLIQSLRRGS